MPEVTQEILAARGKWRFTGNARPEFAEIAGPGEESVWDYPRPPRIEADPRKVEIFADGVLLARSGRALRVLETANPPTYYLPPEDVHTELLVIQPGGSDCEWKGRAAYWSLVMGNVRVRNVAWSYPEPFLEFQVLARWLSFYPAKVDCRLLGQRVRPQPGGRYGGWVTPGIVGPFKGESGTEAW